MNRTALLAGGAVAIVVTAMAVAVAIPDVVAERDGEPTVRSGHLSVEEVTVAPGEVTGETATLRVDTRLRHRGGRSGNVTVLLRATDADSGLVAATEELAVDPIEGDRELSVVGNVTVAREGGYRIETIVYRDGERIATESGRVEGVEALRPAYATSSVGFHSVAARAGGADLPVIEYTVTDVTDNRTSLNVSTRLTNAGDDPAGDLRLVVKARQADSNVVAATERAAVGRIAPGRTASPSVSLTVPDGYNYYLDAVLWRDGVVVGTERSVANLNPTETLDADETREEIGFRTSDFEREERDTPTPEYDSGERAESNGQPGFGVAAALAALAGAALLARTRRNP